MLKPLLPTCAAAAIIAVVAAQIDVAKLEQPVPWPSIHAPWYGYLLWTVAAAGDYGKRADTTIVETRVESKAGCGANIKASGQWCQ